MYHPLIATIMKTVKFLLIGAFFFAMTGTVSAQATDYKSLLETITQYIKDGNTAALKDPLKQYNKLYKKNPEALVALGNAYLSAKNFAKANEYADKAIHVNNKYGNAYILKGDVEAIQDNGGEAANWYMQSMTLDPQNPQGYTRYANVYRKVDPSETERTLKKLQEVLPDYPIEAEAAHSFYTMGDYAKAMDHFLKADPSKLSEEQLMEYAITAINTSKFAEGLNVAEIGLNKNPQSMSFVRLALINAINSSQFEKALSFANTLMANPVEKTSSDHIYYGRALSATDSISKPSVSLRKHYLWMQRTTCPCAISLKPMLPWATKTKAWITCSSSSPKIPRHVRATTTVLPTSICRR